MAKCRASASLRESQSVSPAAVRRPAGAQGHEARAGRDAGDADPVVGPRRDHAGDSGAVGLAGGRGSADEITADLDLAAKVRVIGLDLAVDHRHAHVAAGGDLVQRREPPLPGGGLDAKQGIGVGRLGAGGFTALSAEQADRFGQGDIRLPRQARGLLYGRTSVRHRHDEAVEAEKRHWPVVDQGEAVAAREPAGDAPTRCAAGAFVIAAAVARRGSGMVRRHAQEHKDLARRCRRGIGPHGRPRAEPKCRAGRERAQNALRHLASAASIGSARTMSRRRRRAASTVGRRASGTQTT